MEKKARSHYNYPVLLLRFIVGWTMTSELPSTFLTLSSRALAVMWLRLYIPPAGTIISSLQVSRLSLQVSKASCLGNELVQWELRRAGDLTEWLDLWTLILVGCWNHCPSSLSAPPSPSLRSPSLPLADLLCRWEGLSHGRWWQNPSPGASLLFSPRV